VSALGWVLSIASIAVVLVACVLVWAMTRLADYEEEDSRQPWK
jgi:hypothetical protein